MLDIGNASEQLAANLAATIQATGAQWTEPTIAIVLRDLTRYPEGQVIYALARCRVELKFRLTVGDIIERIEDGRPAADEAWAHVSRALDERASVVATDEALEALGEVRHLASDETAARMAFRSAYQRIVLRHKAEGISAQWVPSLGHDPEGREVALREAEHKGRLDSSQVAHMLGLPEPTEQKALPARSEEDINQEGRERVAAILSDLNGKLKEDRQRQRGREPKIDWQAEEQRLSGAEN